MTQVAPAGPRVVGPRRTRNVRAPEAAGFGLEHAPGDTAIVLAADLDHPQANEQG
jgi:hypothetical protein